MTSFTLEDDTAFDSVPDATLTDDGKIECSECGKRYTINKSTGKVRAHNCNGVRTVETRKTVKRGKRSKDVPANVMRLGSAGIAATVEWSAARLVASYVPCAPSQVPTDIPDAAVMVGPIITAVWPTIPTRAQKIIGDLCDREDLLLCLLAWWDYTRKLSAWAEAAHKTMQNTQVHTTDTDKEQTNELPEASTNNVGRLYAVEPFTPSGTAD